MTPISFADFLLVTADKMENVAKKTVFPYHYRAKRIYFNLQCHLSRFKTCHIYTGELVSRNSGSNLCISMPQKGHNGFGHPRRRKCSDKYLASCNDDR